MKAQPRVKHKCLKAKGKYKMRMHNWIDIVPHKTHDNKFNLWNYFMDLKSPTSNHFDSGFSARKLRMSNTHKVYRKGQGPNPLKKARVHKFCFVALFWHLVMVTSDVVDYVKSTGFECNKNGSFDSKTQRNLHRC